MAPVDRIFENTAHKIVDLIKEGTIQRNLLKLLVPDYLLWLNEVIRVQFKAESNIIYQEGRFVIVGDLHGQFNDLDRILQGTRNEENLKYVFLGDYVDRGEYSLEVISLLFTLKTLYPNKFYLLRGNHECRSLTTNYGFKDECLSKSNESVFESFIETFKTLPLCAVLNNRIFCVHGGISKYIETLSDINKIDRFCEIPTSGPMMDLLWADPDEDVDEFEKSDRGKTFRFGLNPTLKFLKKNRLSLILRGHECVDDGFEFPFEYLEKEGCKCILTVFSASNYNESYNDAAYGIYETKLEFHSLPIVLDVSDDSFENNPSQQNNIQTDE